MQRTQQNRKVETNSVLDHAPAWLSEVRMLIIDDDRLFAEALQLSLLRTGLVHVEVLYDGLDGLELAGCVPYDVVLLGTGLPPEDGLLMGSSIMELSSDVKVIALTRIDDPGTAEEAMRLGFHGCLTKNTTLSHLVRTISRAFEGHLMVASPARRLGERATATATDANLLARQLTQRERDVLKLLVQGATGRQIASELEILPNTVRTHVQSILVRLQVHSRLEAVVYAVDHGVVPSGVMLKGEQRRGPKVVRA